jgi:hypothetical protein
LPGIRRPQYSGGAVDWEQDVPASAWSLGRALEGRTGPPEET